MTETVAAIGFDAKMLASIKSLSFDMKIKLWLVILVELWLADGGTVSQETLLPSSVYIISYSLQSIVSMHSIQKYFISASI